MTISYQDVVLSNLPQVAWALVEASGSDHAPYAGLTHLTSSGTRLYQQAGPFANALSMHFNGDGGLLATNPVVFQPPLTLEMWVKLDAASSGANRVLMYYGNTSSNGFGIYIAAGSTLLSILHGGAPPIVDTGYAMDTNWHLLQLVQETTSVADLYVDGRLVSRPAMNGYAAPSTPIAFMQDSLSANRAAGYIAMPAVYPFLLSGTNAFAEFMASTDPTSALAMTLAQGGPSGMSTSALLQRILGAVTYKGY